MNRVSNKKINKKNRSTSYDHDIFRILADESPNMIFIWKKRKIIFVNKMCIDIMGYSEREFLSEDFNFLKLISSESIDKVKEAINKHEMGMDFLPYE